MKTTAYKVLTNHKGRLFSTWASHDAQVEYWPGEISTAPEYLANQGFHLLAFETLEYAKQYLTTAHGNEIWLVEGRPINLPRVGFEGFMYELYKPYGIMHWPAGTIMLKDIKLIERIYESQPWRYARAV